MRLTAELWNRVWFRDVDTTPFALVRIAVALAALYLWAGTAPVLRRFYTDSGEFPLAEARGWVPFAGAELLLPDFVGSLGAVVSLFSVLFVSLACLLVGYRTGAAALVSWLVLAWFHLRNPTFLNGGDEVVRIALFHMAIGWPFIRPLGRALSVDRARALAAGGPTADAPDPTMPSWPLRLLQIQVCLVYVVAGGWKLLGTSWWDGSVIYYALGNPYLTRFGIPEWPQVQPLFASLTIAVACWEALFPLLVLVRRTRALALLFGVLVHGAIFATMNIGVFSFAMLATYPAFLTAAQARGWVEWTRRRLPAPAAGSPISGARDLPSEA